MFNVDKINKVPHHRKKNPAEYAMKSNMTQFIKDALSRWPNRIERVFS